MDKGVYQITLEWRDWTWGRFLGQGQAVLKLGRDEARALYQEGVEKPVYVRLQAAGEGLQAQQAVVLALGGEIALPPPPKLTTHRDAVTGMEFVLIPKGCFEMGNPANEAGRSNDEGPQHRVCFDQPFYLGKTEVTQGQWEVVMGSNPSEFKGANLPVENVSSNDIQTYIGKLNAQTGKHYRLPSEAEWEYAARAGSTTAYHFGNDADKLCRHGNGADLTAKEKNLNWAIANCRDGYAETAPVGSFAANAFGLYDMHGNVWEWVQDGWHGDYQGSPTDGSAWQTSGGDKYHVLRGGSWYVFLGTSAPPIAASIRQTSVSTASAFGLLFPPEDSNCFTLLPFNPIRSRGERWLKGDTQGGSAP